MVNKCVMKADLNKETEGKKVKQAQGMSRSGGCGADAMITKNRNSTCKLQTKEMPKRS